MASNDFDIKRLEIEGLFLSCSFEDALNLSKRELENISKIETNGGNEIDVKETQFHIDAWEPVFHIKVDCNPLQHLDKLERSTFLMKIALQCAYEMDDAESINFCNQFCNQQGCIHISTLLLWLNLRLDQEENMLDFCLELNKALQLQCRKKRTDQVHGQHSNAKAAKGPAGARRAGEDEQDEDESDVEQSADVVQGALAAAAEATARRALLPLGRRAEARALLLAAAAAAGPGRLAGLQLLQELCEDPADKTVPHAPAKKGGCIARNGGGREAAAIAAAAASAATSPPPRGTATVAAAPGGSGAPAAAGAFDQEPRKGRPAEGGGGWGWGGVEGWPDGPRGGALVAAAAGVGVAAAAAALAYRRREKIKEACKDFLRSKL